MTQLEAARHLDFTTPNAPNAAIVINSLRSLGYDNFAAIADIIDNSIDAEAQHIAVTVQRNQGDFVISILDDGVGMDWDTLDEALKLGSDTSRNEHADLGRYGMGLVTASLSIGRRTDVTTRAAGITTLRSVSDVDEIMEAADFVKYLAPATAEEAADFDAAFTAAGLQRTDHGTIVTISKATGIKYTTTGHFINALKKNLSQIFRKFIAAGKTILVNTEKLSPIDPLGIEGSETFSDDVYEFTFSDDDGIEKTETFRLVMSLLPDFGTDGNKERGIDLKHQGIYVLRNNREIAEAETLGVFTRHNEFNRFRAELYVPGTLDAVLGVNFTKRDVKPNQALTDKLKQITAGQLSTIRARTRRQTAAKSDDSQNHEEAARVIGQKSHLLLKPKAKTEVRPNGGSADDDKSPKTVRKGGKRTRSRQLVEALQNARFESVSLGEGGQIYEAEQEGKTIVVRWNIDHPFYQRFVANNADKGIVTAIDFFIFSLAVAELMVWGDDTAEMIDKMKSIVAMNTRTLLK